MTKKRGNPIASDYLLQGSPTTAATYSDNFPRYLAGGNLAALTTQVMTSVAVPVNAGDIVSSITFISATTAAGTPTNYWFALYDGSGTLLAQTADQLTAAWAANTPKTLALATAQNIARPGLVFAAIMVKATTVPTLSGLDVRSTVIAGTTASTALASVAILSQTSGSSLTTTAPGTIATPTTATVVPYAILT